MARLTRDVNTERAVALTLAEALPTTSMLRLETGHRPEAVGSAPGGGYSCGWSQAAPSSRRSDARAWRRIDWGGACQTGRLQLDYIGPPVWASKFFKGNSELDDNSGLHLTDKAWTTMSAIEYLTEDGTGRYARWHVPDLVPARRGMVELVFVFESPHVEELSAGLPVVGAAGKSDLRFLVPNQPTDLSLGRFVQQGHSAGEDRVAVLNVSNVPMQAGAFVNVKAPELEEGEWALMEHVRRSSARSMSSMRGVGIHAISEVLVDGLRTRLSGVVPGAEGRVVAAGNLAQRVLDAAFPDLTPAPLRVPHPSFNRWHWVVNQQLPDLVDLRNRFERQLSTAQPRGAFPRCRLETSTLR